MRYPQPYVDFAPGMTALHSRGREDSEDDDNDAQDRPSHRSLNHSPNPSAASLLPNRESSIHSRNVHEDSTSHGLNFSETSSVATSIATSQCSSRVSISQHHRKRHPWEHLSGAESLLGSRASDDPDRIRWRGGSTRPTRDLRTRSSSRSVSTTSSGSPPRVRTAANHSMHVRSENDRLELSTHSTQSRTRYASVDTQTSDRQVKPAGFSFQQSQSVQYLNQSHRASARQADPVPITASAVFSSLMGYAVDVKPEKTFHRGVDPPKEKPPTLTSLFRLQEEEAESYEDIRVRQGIELARQTQKSMQKSNYEVDAPPVTNLMVLPEVQGQGMEKEQWKLPNKGQELDQSSNSEADAGSSKSLDSMDELGRSEFVGRFLERDHHPFLQESIGSLEENAQVEDDMFDASQELRDAEEQLENLDHAGAVINSFNRMMEQTKIKPRRDEYAMYEGMPSLQSFGSNSAESKDDLNRNDNLALKAFIQNIMLTIENDLLPAQAKLTDVFKWSEKDNIDNVERSRFRKEDGSERCSTPKRLSRADVFFILNKNNSLPAVLSESWLTTYDGDMNRELNVGNVSNPDSAQMPGTQGCSKSEPVDSELAEQQRTKDGKDMVVVSSSLKPASYCLEESSTSKHLRLSSTSKHLRLSSNVTLKTAEN
ncbi:hypothetical protein MHU86_19226 [Fragilaria crotonensis]|nr:hypothetical protein MHU86_19226 [Fragilaria crotonensis]